MRIAISGIDGSGKTTLCQAIVQWLRERGFPVYFQKLQPKAYQKPPDDQIIDIYDDRLSSIFFNSARILDGDPGYAYKRFSPAYIEYVMTLEEVLLFRREAEKFDQSDSFVIHDRHLLDRRVNARVAGCPMPELEAIMALIRPADITLLLDLPPQLAQERLLAGRGYIAPDETIEEQSLLQPAYLEAAAHDPFVYIVDASASGEIVFNRATEILKTVFPIINKPRQS